MTDPIRRSITVGCTPEQAFRVFTEGMGSWWPLDEFSLAAGQDDLKATDVMIEPRVGGEIHEVQSNGERGSWGEVLAWEPPSRVILAWKPNTTPAPSTELEVTFTAAGVDGTRVDLEHRAWERLGDQAEPARAEYDSGWPVVFDRLYGGAANAASED